MSRMIDEAASAHLDGLVVSLPDIEALTPAIKRAERSGIPVISINSGSDQFRKLGVLAHVGQPEYEAGHRGGPAARRGRRARRPVRQPGGRQRGARRALPRRRRGARARGRPHARARRRRPGRRRRRAAGSRRSSPAGDIDGIITLGPGGATPALAALQAAGAERRIKLATFDLSPEVIEAVRDKQILFAVDQQPYLQGYLPVVMLAERAQHLLFPARGKLIPTGPEFVDARERGARARAQSPRIPLSSAALVRAPICSSRAAVRAAAVGVGHAHQRVDLQPRGGVVLAVEVERAGGGERALAASRRGRPAPSRRSSRPRARTPRAPPRARGRPARRARRWSRRARRAGARRAGGGRRRRARARRRRPAMPVARVLEPDERPQELDAAVAERRVGAVHAGHLDEIGGAAAAGLVAGLEVRQRVAGDRQRGHRARAAALFDRPLRRRPR